MAQPPPSYTKLMHSATYPAIDPTSPALSSSGKVVLITGASGGIGRAAALSFAASGPKSLVLLGRRSDALEETGQLVRSRHAKLAVETHQVDLCDAPGLRAVFDSVASKSGGIDVVVHSAGVLAPVVPLLDADPATFLDGYKTTVVGSLALAQAFVLANNKCGRHDAQGDKPIFINLTTAGILFPPFRGMGAYVSSKMAAVKLLEAFAAENPQVRFHHVHPGFLDTAMSRELAKTTKLPFSYDDSEYIVPPVREPSTNKLTAQIPVSLPADFLVWIASPEAKFLNGKLVFSAWDVEELKGREKEIVGGPPGTGELWLAFKGFPRYIGSHALGH